MSTSSTRKETLIRWSVLGVFLLVTAVWMVQAALKGPQFPDNYTNGYSHSPGGHTALVELLRKNGRTVRIQSGDLSLPESGDTSFRDTLVLLEPDAAFIGEFEDEYEDVFAQARSRGGNLVLVLPKYTYEEGPAGNAGEVVLYEDLLPVQDPQLALAKSGCADRLRLKRTSGPVECEFTPATPGGFKREAVTARREAPVQVFDAPRGWGGMEVLATTLDGDALAVRLDGDSHRGKGIILVSDPEVFTNQHLAEPGAAALAMHIFAHTDTNGTLVLDETLHGYSADASVEYLALTPPGLWVTLAALLLLLLFGWRQATVLRPAEAEPQDRRARVYAIDGLARMMLRARDHHAAAVALHRRAQLLLGRGSTSVQEAGAATKRSNTAVLARLPLHGDESSEERLVNTARRVLHMVRTSEQPPDSATNS
ncbi:MAG: hypothetical protein IT463_06405 [Planctomycetes bacterium]|nr:hypothetical protein [Planctomycetota bacterium]